jgi:hypothetical protein
MRMQAGRTLWSPKMEKLRNFMLEELSGWLGAPSIEPGRPYKGVEEFLYAFLNPKSNVLFFIFLS